MTDEQRAIVREWRNRGEIPTQEMVDEHGAPLVWEYVKECAEVIANATPLDSDSWDDPESYQCEMVALAHGVRLLADYSTINLM